MFYIPKSDAQFVRSSKSVYVQANMFVSDEDDAGNGMGYVDTHLYLYDVGETAEKKKKDEEPEQNAKKLKKKRKK